MNDYEKAGKALVLLDINLGAIDVPDSDMEDDIIDAQVIIQTLINKCEDRA